MIPIGVFFILLKVMIFSDITFASALPKFGCQFDENYNLQNPPSRTRYNELYERHDPIIPIDPIWSEEEVTTVVFKDENEFKVFLNVLNEANNKILEKYKYNTLENMFAFWDDYEQYAQSQSTEDRHNRRFWIQFFQKYTERVKPQDSAFFTIELAKTVVQDHPEFADKIRLSYLSTCSLRNFDTPLFSRFVKNQLGETELPIDYFHDHVMGFMKIQIGKDSDRTGFVVMDPGMALNDIIVLMETKPPTVTDSSRRFLKHDNEDDLHHAISEGKGRIFRGTNHIFSKVGAYIHVWVDKPVIPRGKPLRQLCYIKKGFCSFEDTTRKPELIHPEHSFMSWNSNGDVLGGILVDLFSGIKPEVKLFSRDELSNEIYQKIFNFKTLGELEIILQNSQNKAIVTEVARTLGKTEDELKTYLTKIAETMKDDNIKYSMSQLYRYFQEEPHKNSQPDLQQDIEYGYSYRK